MGKFFEENVKEFMETKVDDLSPVSIVRVKKISRYVLMNHFHDRMKKGP